MCPVMGGASEPLDERQDGVTEGVHVGAALFVVQHGLGWRLGVCSPCRLYVAVAG